MLFYWNTIFIKSRKTHSITVRFKIVYACHKVFSSLGFEEYLVDLAPDAGWLLLKSPPALPPPFPALPYRHSFSNLAGLAAV